MKLPRDIHYESHETVVNDIRTHIVGVYCDLRDQHARIRSIFPEILKSLGTGEHCTEYSPSDFLETIPKLVEDFVAKANCERELFLERIAQIEEIARYWHGISECDCQSELPQGGCLKCDMKKIIFP